MSKYPKLKKMIVRNFRAIKNDVEVELNDIVILVGANNAGKSTILKAYENAVKSEKLTLEDFHNCVIDEDHLPEVEIITIVDKDTAPKIEQWCEPFENDTFLVKEKWTWKKVADKPERVGYRVDANRWATEADKPRMPWATDNVAGSKRPSPHRVSTFDSPEVQSEAVKDLINTLLEEKVKLFKPTKQTDDFPSLIGKFESLKKEFMTASETEVEKISKDITTIIDKIIPNHKFIFSIDEALKSDPFQIFDPKDVSIKFGEGERLYPLLNHGSGARRTILWAILKKLAEMGFEAKSAPKGKKYEAVKSTDSHILLMDEPEISLHPSAIREACNVLYSLPENNIWQVMLTTHSPNFIDLSKDHTTIVRIEKFNEEKIETTTLYRAEEVQLTTDEKENIKFLNLIDPYVLEFFFGGKVILVEGDTEYNAFNFIKEKEKENGNEEFADILVIRARGKVQISSLMKILNHFKKQYFVLHDTDTPKTKRRQTKKDSQGKKYIEEIEIVNPAWTNNSKIEANMSIYSRVYASLINFEFANFNENLSSGKPENAMEKLKDAEFYIAIKKLLQEIISGKISTENVICWSKIEELKTFVDGYEKIEVK
ncbi:AAA family ATPase [Pedobacter sp. UBA4863]|uniref:ATP-dependent nuclease n=1 Tax=Pedobacter sp. UBA4863 TaxID=1947060 RepID=UPI0025E80653|nr:AAA family ATPase [Pedobacter sp. UBA4863]